MKIKMPAQAAKVIQTLEQHGFEAYIVGGCVRDSILGRTPGDWDITTSAAPEETKSLVARTFDTGIEHGTITVLLNGEGFEVLVEGGQNVKKGDPMLKLDLDYIKSHAPSIVSPILCTELEGNQKIRLLKEGKIQAGEPLFAVDTYE